MASVVDLAEQAEMVLTELGSAIDAELSTLSDDALDSLLPSMCGLADGVVAAQTAVVGEWEARGRFLRRFPVVAEALRDGLITVDKVDVLARAAIRARRGLFADAVDALLSDAKRLSCADLARVVACWADVADDHLGRDRSKGQLDSRRLSLSTTLDGSVAVEGRLDTVAGAIVSGELDRIAHDHGDAVRSDAGGVEGLAPVAGDPR